MTSAEGSRSGGDSTPPPDHVNHETVADIKAEQALLARAIGGWRGVIDSGLPAAVFVTAYVISGNQLMLSIWCAVGAGVLIAGWRLLRRESLQQVLAGFVGIAVSAFVAARTGKAEDFFLPGLLLNIAYGAAFLVSILIRWPLVGVIVGFITGERTAWRQVPMLRRSYSAASWIWVGMFFSRVIVQVPLYLAGWVTGLGIARIALGWPLFLGCAYVTYLVLRPTLIAHRENGERVKAESSGRDDL